MQRPARRIELRSEGEDRALEAGSGEAVATRDDAVSAHPAGRLVIVALLALMALGSIAHSVRLDLRHWPFSPVTRAADGSLVSVLDQKVQPRLITFYVGMASRDAAGGPIEQLVGPKNLNALASVEMTSDIPAYSGYFFQQMSGMGFVQKPYDPVLPDAVIRRLLAENRTVEYPMNIVAVVDGDLDGRVVLFTDAEQRKGYCVTLSALPEELRP